MRSRFYSIPVLFGLLLVLLTSAFGHIDLSARQGVD